MKNSVVDINIKERKAKIEDTLYSSFIEHMGRAVYSGIYEPGHPAADKNGFRKDVIDLIRPLNLGLVRYPGGNFVSGYNWRDGIGPKEARPVRLDLAWEAIEPNQFGIDEFMSWCSCASVQPMIAVNLGTGTPNDAAELLEYCNAPAGSTSLARLREANGHKEPYSIKYWCLGNEMDGPWQICAKTPVEYARIAHETAKMMKIIDPSIKLVACGSSSRNMPTFGIWERTVLRECWDSVDYISLHTYYQNDGDSYDFLRRCLDMDLFIDEVQAIIDEIAIEKKSDKKIRLSFDEWNVWYHFSRSSVKIPKWITPRAIDEEDYDNDDSLLVFGMLLSLINHCESVEISCIAQLVNVIAPITTVPGGEAYCRSIYWPLLYVSKYARGTALKLDFSEPDIGLAAVLTEDENSVVVLVENRSLTERKGFEIKGLNGKMDLALGFVRTQEDDKPHLIEPCALDEILLEPGSYRIMLINLEGEVR